MYVLKNFDMVLTRSLLSFLYNDSIGYGSHRSTRSSCAGSGPKAAKLTRSTRFTGASRAGKGVHGSRVQSGLGTCDSCSKIRRFGRVSYCHFPNRPLETTEKICDTCLRILSSLDGTPFPSWQPPRFLSPDIGRFWMFVCHARFRKSRNEWPE